MRPTCPSTSRSSAKLAAPPLASAAVFLGMWLDFSCRRDDGTVPSPVEPVGTAQPSAEVPVEPQVVIHPVGPEGSVPTAIQLRASERLFDGAEAGSIAPESTVVEITPPVAGVLRLAGDNLIEFVPDAPFRPGQHYDVSVKAFGPAAHLWAPAKPWTGSFDTPAFAIARVALKSRVAQGSQQNVELEIQATGTVLPADVAGHVKMVVRSKDGSVRSVGTRLDGSGSNSGATIVRTWVPATGDGVLVIDVTDGVPWSGDAGLRAKAFHAEIPLTAMPDVELLAANLKEGASGHYIDVVCNDHAASGDEHYYYDPETYDGWELSSRCQLDESALSAIHTTPAVELSIAPGPAGFRIFGDFPQGDLQLDIDAGAPSVDGGAVVKAETYQWKVGPMSPTVGFATKGRYVPRSAWKNLGVHHRNVDEVEVVVRHVPAENLVFWMTGEEPASERTSNVVAKKTIAVRDEPDVETTSYIDVASLVPDADNGLYEVSVSAKGVSDHERLVVTDLQIVAKAGVTAQPTSTDITAWVLETHTNAPVKDAELRLIRPSGQVVATCITGDTGGCPLAAPVDAIDPTPAFAILAIKGNELTYLKLSDLKLSLPDDDVAGLPYGGTQPYIAAVSTDRGVYRPGDTVHLVSILRDAAFHAPTGTPAVVKLFDPRGRETRRKVVDPNEAGMATVDWSMGDYAATGSYTATVEVGEAKAGETRFQVEEFVPERLKVTASSEVADALAGDDVPVEVQGDWLFGGAAKGSKVELTCRAEAGSFKPAGLKDFQFGPSTIDGSHRPVSLGMPEGELDDSGHARVVCPGAQAVAALGPATLVASAAVFEGESGRTTVNEARVPVHPSKDYIGLRTSAAKAERGRPFKVQGVTVDWKGQKSTAIPDVQVDIYRMEEEFGWWWDEEEGSRQTRTLRRAKEITQTVAVKDGAFALDVTPEADSAGTLIRAKSGGAVTELFVEGSGRRWYWDEEGGSQVDSTPRPDRPKGLVIALPASVRVGQDVAVSTVSPFAGRILWSVETDGIQHAEWRDAAAGANEWHFKVDTFSPNVYVSALVVKNPHAESAQTYLPDRAVGTASLKVEPVDFQQDVKLDVPTETRPYQPLDVTVSVGPSDGPTWVALAAVDEGILSLTKFKSPNPLDQVFARRALGVSTYETLGWTLAVEPGGPSGSAGGDAAGGGGRVQMVKPVALWSGMVQVPSGGSTKVHFDVPGYRGQLRIMAVSASPGRIGHADAVVTVKDPLVLQTTLPRFLATSDEAMIPVMVSNQSGKAQEVQIKMVATNLHRGAAPDVAEGELGPALVFLSRDGGEGRDHGSMSLQPGEAKTAVFRVKAREAPGAAHLLVTATAGELSSKEELDVPIEAAGGEVRDVELVRLHAGPNDLKGRIGSWVPNSDRTTLWVSSNPYAQALTHLRHLIRYPYGCIEQTTSTTRPLLYVSQLLPQIDPDLIADGSVEKKVQSGIDRLFTMQTPSGGFGFWPGDTEPVLWGSTYVVHLMLDAKELGYQVPTAQLQDAIDWLDRNVETAGAGTHYHFDVMPGYTHYVLARAGKPHVAAIEQELAVTPAAASGREGEGRYLLMAALYASGDHRYERELHQLDVSPVSDVRLNDWSYYSDIRGRAMELTVFQELFGRAAEGGQKSADQVAAYLASHPSSYWSTQEEMWGVTALGKWVSPESADLPVAKLLWGGKTVAPAQERSLKGNLSWQTFGASHASSLLVDLQSEPKAPLYVVATTEGVKANEDVPVGGFGLQVRRSWSDAGGRALGSADALHLGDLVYVTLDVENTSGHELKNLALADRIPAGAEIENPRLGRGSMPEWVDPDAQWALDFLEVKDDRLAAFGTLQAGEKKQVVYAIRLVTAGSFEQPPVSMEAQYDPSYWARSAGERVAIDGGWDDEIL